MVEVDQRMPVASLGARRADDEAAPGSDCPIRVFVHLARDKDAVAWGRAFRSGTLVGINDETPYGYGRAERMGCRIVFSRSGPEGLPAKILRLGLRALTGFDYLHARRQRRAMAEADVVWTHTESQFLAVAAVLRGMRDGPKLLGQSVWLFDRWPALFALKRALYRHLIHRVDLLTFLSTENLKVAAGLFPESRVAMVRFGIPAEEPTRPTIRSQTPVRVLAIGNDRHRDWPTLVEAVRGRADMDLTILSGTIDPRLVRGCPNVRVRRVASNSELKAEFAAATLAVVPLRANKHASGITVIQECVLAGLPVVASATGGLTDYFSDDTIRYVAPADPAALGAAIHALAADPAAACAMAVRAQSRMADPSMGAEAFVGRHVELSREMLAR
jgi:glycosyltransferase involved in cell wall biosynthesis